MLTSLMTEHFRLPWACVVAGGQGGTQLKGGESLLSDLSFHTKKSRRSNHGISLLGERLLWSTDSWEGLKIRPRKCLPLFLKTTLAYMTWEIEKTSTENGFLVSLEALCFIELVSELLFFISPFYFFSGMSLPSSSVQLLSRV